MSLIIKELKHKIYFDRKFYATLDAEQATKIVRNGNPKKWKDITALSHPSKLTCLAWSISAWRCGTGTRLREILGTVCSKCYATHGHFLIGRKHSVGKALEERYQGWLTQEHWVEAMAFLIVTFSREKFRWFDSGDIQDFQMLLQIAEIARVTKTTKYWLPTHEVDILTEFVEKGYEVPENLAIRLSGDYIDNKIPENLTDMEDVGMSFDNTTALAIRLNAYPNVKGFIGTSGVLEKENWAKSPDACPSSLQGNSCQQCTRCWQATPNIDYKRH